MSAAARPCIVDARLAFSEFGLLTVARVASVLDVWLPRRVRQITVEGGSAEDLCVSVDYSALRGLDDRDAQRASVQKGLRQWRRLPGDDEFARLDLYFVGDRADDSKLPPHVRSSLRERMEQLAEGLDIRVREKSRAWRSGRDFVEAARDGLALAAALSPLRAFILTRLESDRRGAPALCDYAGDWFDAEPVQVSRPEAIQSIEAALHDADLAPLEWAGANFAAVHVVVPGAPPIGRRHADMPPAEFATLWAGARVYWHRLLASTGLATA